MNYIKRQKRCIYLEDDTWAKLSELKRAYHVGGRGAVIDILAKIAPPVKPRVIYSYQVVAEEQPANG